MVPVMFHSGADLGALVREASVSALKEFMRKRKGLDEDDDINNNDDNNNKDGVTKFPPDGYNGPCELLKTIVLTSCPSAREEKLDDAAQGMSHVYNHSKSISYILLKNIIARP